MEQKCIFCQIIAGNLDGSLVYEGDEVVAFMDINQPNHYKVLVVPRRHATMIYDLDEVQAGQIMQVATKIARAIRAVTNCDGLNVFQANGAIAGQEVFHYHMHLLPRYNDDGHSWRKQNHESREVLDKLAADLRAQLATME